MFEKRENEWNLLEDKALKMLANIHLLPKDAILRFYRPVLRLWIYPSFEPHQVWFFSEPDFKTINPKTFRIIKAVWDRNEDYKRLSNPFKGLREGFGSEPKIEVSSIEIEREFFENLFNDLQTIPFPAFANYRKSIGIDGVRSGIETFDFTHRTTISWWSIYPTEWQKIVDWFEKTVDSIEKKFKL